MTDPRPRPQYGEYATPEEQAKAMGVVAPAPGAPDGSVDSKVDVAPAGSTSGSASGPASSSSGSIYSTGGETPATTPKPDRATSTSPRPRRAWDSVLTAVFLGVGVVSVTSSVPQYADFPNTMNLVLAQLGYGEYSAIELANTVGLALNISQIVLFVVSAVVAIVMIRRGRLGFFYPLIGATLFLIVMVVLLIVTFAGDPVLMSSLTGA